MPPFDLAESKETLDEVIDRARAAADEIVCIAVNSIQQTVATALDRIQAIINGLDYEAVITVPAIHITVQLRAKGK